MNRRPTTRARFALATAVLAMPALLLAPKASAQQQIAANGTALDANNRIGSQGINTYRPAPSSGVLGNQIINGNVSNGREFRGSVPYSDPNEFAGFQAGRAVANFEKNSVGVGVPYTPSNTTPNNSTPYYSETRFAAPATPGMYTTTVNGNAYVPAQPLIVQQNDTRLGARLDAVAVEGELPKPGELVLPGPVDPTSNNRTIFTSSALTGVRPWNTNDASALQYLSQFTGMRPETVLDRMQISQNDLTKIREELRSTSGLNVGAENTNAAAVNANPTNQLVGQPLEAPLNANLDTGPLNGAIANNPVGAQTPESVYNRVLGVPEKQSATYNELKNRLAKYEILHKDKAQQSADAYNRAKQALAAQNQKQPGAEIAEVPNKQTGKPGPQTKPLIVQSLSEGVKAPGLKELLAKAEGLMKEGKFSSAIDTYSAAEQIVPNQPLIWMGRANAELGAAYYGRAEAHLKQAFNSDKALLMAQYDLRSFLGEDRLKAVVKDLQEIARTDAKSPTPVFLLAYISYNTGNESRAAAYLDIAEKRSDGKDPIFKTLRDYWSLPPGSAVPELNK